MPAKLQLNIIIVGAGLGGLAASIALRRGGHNVTILEQAAALGEVGAGIQIPPNSSRILIKWGLKEKMENHAVIPKALMLRGYKDGKILSTQNLVPYTQEVYKGPYWHVHRADFHNTMVQAARDLGVKIQLNSCVTSIDFSAPSVTLKTGDTITADLIVGADGLKSRCREEMMGRADPPHLTGDLAYRIIVKADEMRKDPDLRELTEDPAINFWLGPDAHAACYLLKGGGLYNIVLLCPDNMPADVNVVTTGPEEVRDFFKTWDPRLGKLLNMVHEVSKWRLQNSREMETWLHPEGKFVLLGDACHATLPYLAQGAAMAVEDGAVLGGLLERLEDRAQLKGLLAAYESLRKKRTTRIVLESTHQRDVFHLPNGPVQEARDLELLRDELKPGFPNKWRDPEFQKFLFGYDAFAEVETAWARFKSEGSVNSML